MYQYSGALPMMGLETFDDVDYQALATVFTREQTERDNRSINAPEASQVNKDLGVMTETGIKSLKDNTALEGASVLLEAFGVGGKGRRAYEPDPKMRCGAC